MRPQSQIRQQLKQVTFRHLKKQLRELFKQRPTTCRHNRVVTLDEGEGTYVRLCGVLSSDGIPRNIPCDDRLPGCSDMARECPLWGPLRTKAEVKAEFQEVMQSQDRGVIATAYPDVAALMWVLDDPGEVLTESEIEATEGEEPEPAGSWVGGLIRKFGVSKK